MIASATWKGGTQYEGKSDSGHAIPFDTDKAHTTGPSPMEAVLAALCACTSVDVVGILQKKRQPLTGLVVSAQAKQPEEAPRVFTEILVTYSVSGNGLSRKAVEDAVALSKDKYCSVSIMLQESVAFSSAIEYSEPPQP